MFSADERAEQESGDVVEDDLASITSTEPRRADEMSRGLVEFATDVQEPRCANQRNRAGFPRIDLEPWIPLRRFDSHFGDAKHLWRKAGARAHAL